MYLGNTNIGGLRIYMNLLHLGYKLSRSSVYRALRKIKMDHPGKPTQQWKTFLKNSKVVAMDFLTVSVEITKDVFQQMYIFVMIDHERRKIVHYNCTPNPSQEWVIQQFRNGFDQPHDYKYMVHDRDTIFMNQVSRALAGFGLESTPTAPRSPWQNPFVESFNATLRRELLNHVIIKDEMHLRKLLREYVDFYNNQRMHSGLMDSPNGLQHYTNPPTKNTIKQLRSTPVLNGLHRVYYWKDAA